MLIQSKHPTKEDEEMRSILSTATGSIESLASVDSVIYESYDISLKSVQMLLGESYSQCVECVNMII